MAQHDPPDLGDYATGRTSSPRVRLCLDGSGAQRERRIAPGPDGFVSGDFFRRFCVRRWSGVPFSPPMTNRAAPLLRHQSRVLAERVWRQRDVLSKSVPLNGIHSRSSDDRPAFFGWSSATTLRLVPLCTTVRRSQTGG